MRNSISLVITIAWALIFALIPQRSYAQDNVSLVDAVNLYDNGDYSNASLLFERILKQNRDNDAAHYYLGMSYYSLKETDKAELHLLEAVRLDGSNFWYKYRLAQFYSYIGRNDESIAIYEKLLADYPKRDDLYFDLIDIYLALGKNDEAMSTLDKIETSFGKNESTCRVRVNILNAQGKEEEALKCLKAFNKDYSSPWALSVLANYEMSMYNDSTAIAYYNAPPEFDIIGSKLVKYNGITEDVTIPDGVTVVGMAAFDGNTAVKKVYFPGSLKKIEGNAFRGCVNLEEINMPEGVEEIGRMAFEDSAITDVTIPSSLKTFGIFSRCEKVERVVIPPTVTAIGDNAFENCFNLKEVIIPDSVNYIGINAFKNCTGLTELTIPESVNAIGGGAFKGCKNLKTLNIPREVSLNSSGHFYGCESLETIEIPNNLRRIHGNMFYGCKSLRRINIPSDIVSIESSAFGNCKSLTIVTIPAGVEEIKSEAFKGCSNLTNVDILGNDIRLGSNVFEDCEYLEVVDFHGHIEELGYDIFDDCPRLKAIFVKKDSGYERVLYRLKGEGLGNVLNTTRDGGDGLVSRIIKKII